MIKRLIVLGAPGVGKGTQAKRLEKEFGWKHISTGDMLRSAVREGTSLGKRVKEIMEQGELVPDALMIELISERLVREDCKSGFILDGFPRTVVQAQQLDGLLRKQDAELDGVLSIHVPNEEIVRRLTQRRVCDVCGSILTLREAVDESHRCPSCGGQLIRRKDDHPETIRHRLTVYEKQSHPLIKYYEGRKILKQVEGTGSEEEIYLRILDVLGIRRKNDDSH